MYGKFTDWLTKEQTLRLFNVNKNTGWKYLKKIETRTKFGKTFFYPKKDVLPIAQTLNDDWERQLRYINAEMKDFGDMVIDDWTTHSDSMWSHVSRQRFHQIRNKVQRIKWGRTWFYNKEDLNRHFTSYLSVDARNNR